MRIMNVKIKKWILIPVTIIVLVLISFLIIRNLRLYDSSKPNIFEIPGTAYTYTPYRSNERYVTKCYMVQNVPNNNEAMELMVSDVPESLDKIYNELGIVLGSFLVYSSCFAHKNMHLQKCLTLGVHIIYDTAFFRYFLPINRFLSYQEAAAQ